MPDERCRDAFIKQHRIAASGRFARVKPFNGPLARDPPDFISAAQIGLEGARVAIVVTLHAGAGVRARITVTDVRRRDGGTFVRVSVVLIDAADQREILRCQVVDKYED